MADGGEYNVAIETSSRRGSVTLGRGDAVLATVKLAEQQRHAVELLPALDRLCREHAIHAPQIREIYVSIGPGSFTGLRVSVTTAKVLSRVTGARVVAVPTLRVIAGNVAGKVAVMLNAKGGRWFTAVYDGARELIAPCLMTPPELCNVYRGPVIADQGPEHESPADIEWIDASLAVPRSEVVWELGRAMAKEGLFTPAAELVPLYVRLPDAEELWQTRNAKPETRNT